MTSKPGPARKPRPKGHKPVAGHDAPSGDERLPAATAAASGTDMGVARGLPAPAAAPASAVVPGVAAGGGESDLITEEEFDQLLEELRRDGRQPGVPEPPASVTPAPADAVRVLVLAENFGIDRVSALHAELGGWLDEPGDVVLEAAGVETVDTAALQLLFAFARDARARGVTVRWQQPSAALLHNAALLDLTAALALD